MQDLLHELIGGEGHSLGGNTADVVERKASVQSLLDPVLVVHVHDGLPQRSVQMMEKFTVSHLGTEGRVKKKEKNCKLYQKNEKK